jgi:excisionase family DNA binding protein
MDKYVNTKEACRLLGVHQRTLHNWDRKGKIKTIRTPGNHRLYNVEEYVKKVKCKNEVKCIENLEKLDEIKGQLSIGYVRVSSQGQKDDLERQMKEMINKYPKHLIIKDIGSGLNFNRRGLRKIINLGIEGKIKELVVLHKDRLTRHGFELITDIIEKYSNGKVIIDNKKEDKSQQEEIIEDVLHIMNVYVAKMNGIRKYNKNKGIL